MSVSRRQQAAQPIVIAAEGVDTEYTTGPHRRHLPPVLRLPCLLAFGAFVTILCLFVGFFWHFTQRPDGIQISAVNHYVLAYGPTAVLVWLVAFWRQVDFHVKDLTPWNELCSGTSCASQSVVLDYVSTLQITALWTAIRNRHIPVVVTTLGFTLLKIATLSSTGFLLVQSYYKQQDVTATLQSRFLSPYINDANNTALFDQSLFYTTYGVLAQNLSKPFGLGEGFAYATFKSEPVLTQATNLIGEVDGFVPSFQCIPTNVSAILPAMNTTDAFPNTLVQIKDTACSLRAQNVGLYTLNPRLFRCPPRQLSGVMSSIDCPTSVFNNDDGVYKLFVMADFRYVQDLDDNDQDNQLSASVVANNWSTEIAQIGGIICRLSYSMHNVTVNLTGSEYQAFLPEKSLNNATKLENFSDDDFDLLFRSSISASDGILGDRVVEGYALEYPDPMLKMMALVSGGSYEDLLDNTVMSRTANEVSTQLGAQIAHQYLRGNVSTSTIMQAIWPARRISVAAISAYILLISLGLVTGICFYLALLLKDYVAGDMENALIRTGSLVLQHSEVVDDIIASQSSTEKQLKNSLRNVNVRLEHSSDIGTNLVLNQRPVFSGHKERKLTWWNPITVNKVVLTVVFLITLTVIIVLEVLQHVSGNDHGFATLPGDTTRQTIFTHYIPALFFLLLTSMYTCLDFNALLLYPFQRLRTSIDVTELRHCSQLGRVPVFAWWQALRNKSWGTATSTTAALIGSLLTIVVSGLFEVDILFSSQTLVITASDSFTPHWNDSGVTDGGASLISSLTENLHFPYPPGTFDQIAYPFLQMQNGVGGVLNSTIVVDVPVWRAHLRCQRLLDTNIGVQTSPSPIQNSVVVNASYSLPPDCLRGGQYGNESVLQFIQSFNFPTSHNSTYLGQLLDLHVGPYNPILGSAEGENVPSAMDDNSLGCPSIGLIYGFIDLESSVIANGGVPDTVAVEICYQELQSIHTTLTFQNANFDLDATEPLNINESSVKYITTNDDSAYYTENAEMATAFPFRVQGHMDDTFAVFNKSHDNAFGELSNTGDTVDTFFQGVLFGRTPIPVSSLRLENENQTSQIQQGILAFYRRYMAQAISSNMRLPSDISQKDNSDTKHRPVYPASAPTGIVTNRIVQNKTSKLILQVMLGVMLVCGVFTALTVQMHNLLLATANPCTIWGQMSLWAGSDIHKTSDGEVTRTRDDGKGTVVVVERSLGDDAGDVLFQLGWWTTRNGRQRYGIDVVPKQT